MVSSSVKSFINISEFNPRYSHIKGDISLMALSYSQNEIVRKPKLYTCKEQPEQMTLTNDDIVQYSQNCFIYGAIARYNPIHFAFPYPTCRHPVSKNVSFLLSVALLSNFMPPLHIEPIYVCSKDAKSAIRSNQKGGGGGGRLHFRENLFNLAILQKIHPSTLQKG